MTPSNSQINKAGRILRKMHHGKEAFSAEQFQWAFEILSRFRWSHAIPLLKADQEIQSLLLADEITSRPTQRLKRVPTIIDKLIRYPTMALAKMQDIGGCRVVRSDVATLRRLERRIRLSRLPFKTYDYIRKPKPTGYRAVHLVVAYDERLIEIQLRTAPMDEWATAQERVGALLNTDLKSGKGPPEVLDTMQLLSEVIALEEQTQSPDAKLPEKLQTALRALLLLMDQAPGEQE